MPFPQQDQQKDKPGRFHRNDESSQWVCDICGSEFPDYQQIIGHMGAHPIHGYRTRPTGRPTNARSKDPMNMTIIELVETIETLRQKIIETEESAKDAIVWQSKVKALFTSEE